METLTEEVEAVEPLLSLQQDAPVELLILDSAAVRVTFDPLFSFLLHN